MNKNIPSRKELLHLINIASFAVDDTKLFLDTHPENKEALSHFQEYNTIRAQALEDFSRLYGPLTLDSITDCSDYWQWIEEPYPWQEGGC
ncbi:spore coat protein CotJB [Faecalimonas sp.]